MKYNKIILAICSLFFFLLLVNNVNAYLGAFDSNTCIQLLASPLNNNNEETSFVALSSVRYPTGYIQVLGGAMDLYNGVFNYTFCNTSREGLYYYDYRDGDNNRPYTNTFTINKVGGGLLRIDFTNTIVIILFSIFIIFALLLIFFRVFAFSGAIFLVMGILLLFNGYVLFGAIGLVCSIILMLLNSK